MNNLSLEIPEGYEFDSIDETSHRVILKPITKYPSHMHELPRRTYYIGVQQPGSPAEFETDGPTLESREDVDAILALVKLMAFRDEYNRIDGYTPIFDGNHSQWRVYSVYNYIAIEENTQCHNGALVFGSEQTARIFMSNFGDLLYMAKNFI